MENTRQASQLSKPIQSHKKARNSDQVSPINSKTNLRNASARTNQSRTQKINEKSNRQTVPRKIKYLNQSQQLAERLLMATFFDVDDTQRNLSNFIKSRENKSKIDIPKMFQLINLHEKLFNRAYSEQLKYYIVSLLWDQGLVEVGQTQKWVENINKMLEQQQKNGLGNQLGQIDEIREQSIQQASSELTNIANNMQKNVRSLKNSQINGQLQILLQSIEQQYHRQQITLRHFITQSKTDKQIYDKICDMYSCLDQSHVGSVMIDQLFSKFAPSGKQLSLETRYFILNRIINNLHIYDQHRHTIINPTHSINNQNSTGIRVTIQQIMQLINRIYQQSGNMSFHPCQTFRAIHYILSRYQQLEDDTRRKSFNQQKSALHSRNKQLIIASKIQHIRQAAADIVQQGKINGLNFTSRFRENTSANEKQYETEKNIGEMMIDEQNTFRGNKKLKPQNLFPGQSKIKGFQYNQEKQGLQQREIVRASNSFSSKIKSAKNLTDFTKKTNMTWNIQTSKVDNKYWDKSPQIKEFEISDQIIQRKLDGIDESMVREQMELKIKEENAKYDRLLRERILTQLEIVRLERIRNRIRYYDVAFQFQ